MTPKTLTAVDECLIKARNEMRRGGMADTQPDQFYALWSVVAWLLEAAEIRSGVEPGEAHKRAVAAEKQLGALTDSLRGGYMDVRKKEEPNG